MLSSWWFCKLLVCIIIWGTSLHFTEPKNKLYQYNSYLLVSFLSLNVFEAAEMCSEFNLDFRLLCRMLELPNVVNPKHNPYLLTKINGNFLIPTLGL